MQKRLKITLYIILILVIIAVIWLIFGKTNRSTDTQTLNDTNIEKISTGEESENSNDNGNTLELEIQGNTFEDDVMNDLEGFFNDNNGYEDVQGEFGFTSLETE